MRVMVWLLFVVLPLSGCLGPEPGPQPEVAPEPPTPEEHLAAELAVLEPAQIGQRTVLRLEGPGTRVVRLYAEEPFTVSTTGCQDHRGCGWWGFVLRPMVDEDAAAMAAPANGTCDALPSDMWHWFSPLESYNVFWPDLAPGHYQFHFWSSRASAYIEFNDGDYESDPYFEPHALDTSHLYQVHRLEPRIDEGPGAPATYGAAWEGTFNQTSLVLGRAEPTFLTGLTQEPQSAGSIAQNGTTCATAVTDDPPFPAFLAYELRLDARVRGGHPVLWQVEARADASATVSGHAGIVAIEAAESVTRPFWA